MEYVRLRQPERRPGRVPRRPGRPAVHRLLAPTAVVAGMNVNVWDVTGPIQALIRSRRSVDIGRLTDPAVPLEELAPEA